MIPEKLISYVKKMISPPDKEAVFVNLDSFDPLEYEENTIPGLIVSGDPTEDQSDALYRLLMPGAHLVFIGKKQDNFGSSQVSKLEDVGFEVRDCILYACDPDKTHYVSKPSRSEKEEGCEALEGDHSRGFVKNTHPTVKPISLMRKLVRKHKGLVLDPFNGSGTTGVSVIYEGGSYHGIDLSNEYLKISNARMQHAAKKLRKQYEFRVPDYVLEKISLTKQEEGMVFE